MCDPENERRITNAFSKKIENHACAVALHSMYYDFVRILPNAQNQSADGRWRDGSALGNG